MLEAFQYKKDRSLRFLHGEAMASSVENAGIGYQAPSLLAFGGNARDIAFLSSATNLFFALLLMRVPSFLKSADGLKKAVLVLTLLSALFWIPLILVPWLVPQTPVFVLIGLWVLNLIPGFLAVPIHDKWVADLVPARRIGSYFGLRQMIAASSYLATFYLLGFLMDSFGGGGHRIYSLVFTIAFLGCLSCLFLCLLVRKSEVYDQDYGNRFGLLDFLHESRQNNMATFIVYITLIVFATSMSSSFFSVYMLQNLHFNYLTYALIISIEYIARIASLTIWGKVVDNTGAIRLLKVISFVIPVVPVLWLFSANLFYLGLVQFLSGVSWAAFDLCNQTHICSASPESRRLHYIVYQRCVITIASALGPLLGAYLLSRIWPVFGSPILTVFLVSGVIRLLVAVFLSFKLKSVDSVRPEESYAMSAVQVLYQAPREHDSGREKQYPRFSRQPAAAVNPYRKRIPSAEFNQLPVMDRSLPGTGTQHLSPYRRSLIAARRLASAEMLKGRSNPQPEAVEVIHRLQPRPVR